MALLCPACGTENRAVAKFCIECIGPLDAEFEPTQLVARRDSSSCTTLMGMPTALAEFAASSPSSAPAPTRSGKARAAEPRKGLWLSVAAFAIVLAIGAGGWMIAGAGGLYLYSASAVEAAPPAPPALAPMAAATVAPVPLSAPALAPLPVVSFVAPVEAPAPAVAPAAIPAAPRVVVAARSVAPPAAPRVIVPTDPGAACADLGFIARTRCVATQCSKTEYRGHSSCQAVFAQQRLMEEKRNPTLAN